MNAETATAPVHVGFILDGNRRWARHHTLPEMDGHLAGYNALKDVMRACFDSGVQYVSIYTFSTENWQRDGKEISGLMRLAMRVVTTDLKELIRDRIRVRFLGRTDGISTKLLKGIEKAEEATGHFTGRTLAVCFNYGGQQEIADAARACVVDGLAPEAVTEQAMTDRMYAPDVPPIDITVRTSGEQRLSNFMLWRISYSELLFIDKFWPDMTKQDVTDIINEYNRRVRRFGGA
jgi:undecaprenyl diphosphate synthase